MLDYSHWSRNGYNFRLDFTKRSAAKILQVRAHRKLLSLKIVQLGLLVWMRVDLENFACRPFAQVQLLFYIVIHYWLVINFRTVQIWLKRDSGQYWPSVCQYVPSQATCLHIHGRDIFIGLENGTVIQYELAPDCNKLEHKIDILSHVGRVTGIHYTNGHVLSVSRDKTFVWADQRTANTIASHAFAAWCTCLV